MAGHLVPKMAVAAAGTCFALLASIALASAAAADHEICVDAELNNFPCPHPTTTTTTTTAPTTTTTTPPTTLPSTSTTSSTTSTTTTTAAPPPRQTTTTTAAPVALATTSTTLPTLATVVVEPGTTTSAAQTVVSTPETATATTILVEVTTTTSEPDPPEVTIADAEAVEEALPFITPTTPGPPTSGSSTQVVWVILIGLNVVMIAAVTIRRRLRRTSMLGSFNGV